MFSTEKSHNGSEVKFAPRFFFFWQYQFLLYLFLHSIGMGTRFSQQPWGWFPKNLSVSAPLIFSDEYVTELRVPHPLWDFAVLPISPPTIAILLVSRSTFMYFLLLPHILEFPVLSVLSRTFPLKILLSMPAPAYFSTPLYPFLQCTSISRAFSYLVLPMFVPHFSQNPVEHSPSSVLSFLPYFAVLWILHI